MLIAGRSAYIPQGEHMPVRSSPTTSKALRKLAQISTILIGVALIGSCADRTNPTGLQAGSAASTNGLPFAADLLSPLSPVWQQTPRTYVGLGNFIPVQAGHAYPLLGVAQYLAVQQAEASLGVADVEAANAAGNNAGGRRRVESIRGAVAGASAVVLSYLFSSPAQIQAFEDMVNAQATAGPGEPGSFRKGEAIGRAVGAAIVRRAVDDGYGNSYRVDNIPVGDGFWVSNTKNPFTINGGQKPGGLPLVLSFPRPVPAGPPPPV